MADNGEDLCAADYIRLLLLSNFKGRAEVDRLENFIKRSTYAPVKLPTLNQLEIQFSLRTRLMMRTSYIQTENTYE